jgi:hypothetical protein
MMVQCTINNCEWSAALGTVDLQAQHGYLTAITREICHDDF